VSATKKSYPLVEILWLDAEADPAWKTEDEVVSELTGDLCVTVGFLIRKPSKAFPMYVVAGTATCQEKPHFNNTMKIPKYWVTSIKTIREEYILWQEIESVAMDGGKQP
jgi:hypothetical protein